MKICHVCGAQCTAEQEVCYVCGADLTQSEAVTEEAISGVITEPMLLATFEDVVSAEIFRDILTENEIPFSMGENEGSVRVIFGGGFTADEIYVDKSDFEKAEALYNEFMENEPEFEGEFIFDDEETE